MTHSTESITESNSPSITFLNMTGDITIAWDKSSEEAVLLLIEQKLKEGYSFFVLKPRKFGFIPLPSKKVAITSIVEARNAGHVRMLDEDVLSVLNEPAAPLQLDDASVEALIQRGNGYLIRPLGQPEQAEPFKISKASTILKHQSMAIRPLAGG